MIELENTILKVINILLNVKIICKYVKYTLHLYRQFIVFVNNFKENYENDLATSKQI